MLAAEVVPVHPADDVPGQVTGADVRRAANVAATVALLSSGRPPRDATAVTVLCDTGLNY
ncbi:hypothetical protein [Methylobacterium oryzae]|uniref:hypothetical protein n=1 Tax=Methylobacterium oryzae TaxID=334852 RepID=UPI002F35DF6A